MKLRMMTHFTPTPNDGSSIGSFDPLFQSPPGFKPRLGGRATDEFVSGTFPVGSYNIGFIRISSFTPFSTVDTAENQFLTEVQYFQKNTDGLIVDVMNNPGGDGCYSQDLVSFLTPYSFRGWVSEIRATQSWLLAFSQSVFLAEQSGAPQWVIDIYNTYLKAVKQALSENRGRTGPLPICALANAPDDPSITIQPPTDSKGNIIAYTKPLLVLTDGYSVSSAELLTMSLQDAQRATIFGMRTDGDSGSDPEFQNATDYSEGSAVVSVTLTPRSQAVGTPGFPVTPYYEGIGIYPDIVQDYMTKDNLLNGGKTFVAAFSTAISNLISNSK